MKYIPQLVCITEVVGFFARSRKAAMIWVILTFFGSKKVIWLSADSLLGKVLSRLQATLNPAVSQVTGIQFSGENQISWIQDFYWHFFKPTGANFSLTIIQGAQQVGTDPSTLGLS